MTANVGIEDPNLLVGTGTRIWLDIAKNNQQQTQPMGKIKEEIKFDNTHTKIRIDGRKEVHLAELPYQVRLNNNKVRLAQGGGNGKRDPSSPTLPWPRRPALGLTEQKRRGTRVVTLRIRERFGLWKVGHTTMVPAQNPLSWVTSDLKNTSMATLIQAIPNCCSYAHSQPMATKGWFGFGVSLS